MAPVCRARHRLARHRVLLQVHAQGPAVLRAEGAEVGEREVLGPLFVGAHAIGRQPVGAGEPLMRFALGGRHALGEGAATGAGERVPLSITLK